MVNSRLTLLAHRPLRGLFILASVLVATLAFSMAMRASTAAAATKYVCADSISFRSSPGGSILGHMYRNNTINITGTSGAWSHGSGCYGTAQGGTACGTGWALTEYLSSSPC
jgi:hypothetical protein